MEIMILWQLLTICDFADLFYGQTLKTIRVPGPLFQGRNWVIFRRGAQVFYKRKDEIKQGLSQSVKYAPPLFSDMSSAKVWNAGEGAHAPSAPVPVAPLPCSNKAYMRINLAHFALNCSYCRKISVQGCDRAGCAALALPRSWSQGHHKYHLHTEKGQTSLKFKSRGSGKMSCYRYASA